MKILYLPCHKRLRVEEKALLTELGHEVIDGTIDPIAIEKFDYDICILVHKPVYWKHIKPILNNGIPVYFRSIGQSTVGLEQELTHFRKLGMKIIRFSPNESVLPSFAGQDHLIRFYKDENKYVGYTGTNSMVFGFSKRVSSRPRFVSYNTYKEITKGFNSVIIGYNNDDLKVPSYEVPEEDLVEHLGRFTCCIYTGTFPASYSLGFIECMMIGIPMVCIGEKLWFDGQNPYKGLYEIPNIIDHTYNGFVCESIEYARDCIDWMMTNPTYRTAISINGRKRAIEIFGKETIKKQWISMLEEAKNVN